VARGSQKELRMRISHQAHTDVGRRANNEDAYVAAPDLGFFAVADGMGGYEGGEVASRLALESLLSYFERLGKAGLELDEEGEPLAREQMRMAIRMADREVKRCAVGELEQMGTTIACLVVRGRRALIAHVGDSRIYRMRDGEVTQLTRDHSLVAEMEAAGLVAAAHLCHVITQALGQGTPPKPDLQVVDVMPGDRFLMCTDGLTDALSTGEIGEQLSHRNAAQALVDEAFELGSLDNITCVVVSAR
jgi:PPM family protein phosphatase